MIQTAIMTNQSTCWICEHIYWSFEPDTRGDHSESECVWLKYTSSS